CIDPPAEPENDGTCRTLFSVGHTRSSAMHRIRLATRASRYRASFRRTYPGVQNPTSSTARGRTVRCDAGARNQETLAVLRAGRQERVVPLPSGRPLGRRDRMNFIVRRLVNLAYRSGQAEEIPRPC